MKITKTSHKNATNVILLAREGPVPAIKDFWRWWSRRWSMSDCTSRLETRILASTSYYTIYRKGTLHPPLENKTSARGVVCVCLSAFCLFMFHALVFRGLGLMMTWKAKRKGMFKSRDLIWYQFLLGIVERWIIVGCMLLAILLIPSLEFVS